MNLRFIVRLGDDAISVQILINSVPFISAHSFFISLGMADSPICKQLMEFINANPVLSSYMTNMNYIPAPDVRLRAIKLVPQPRVLIFGQDPYPRAESASGMAFNDLKVK